MLWLYALKRGNMNNQPVDIAQSVGVYPWTDTDGVSVKKDIVVSFKSLVSFHSMKIEIYEKLKMV